MLCVAALGACGPGGAPDASAMSDAPSDAPAVRDEGVDASSPTDAMPEDAPSADSPPSDAPDRETSAPSPTQCAMRGGTCTPGVPSSSPPGFTVTCGPGYALADGRSTETNGGFNLFTSSNELGCSRNPDGTQTPRLCCLPATAGDAGTGDAARD